MGGLPLYLAFYTHFKQMLWPSGKVQAWEARDGGSIPSPAHLLPLADFLLVFTLYLL